MVGEVDDALLVRAAKAGDLDAFEVLLRRHETAVYRVALRMLDSTADAQDAAQEAFVQAWRSIGRFRGDSAFSTWMYRIVTNRCLNTLAAGRAEQPLPAHPVSSFGDPAKTVEDRDRMRALSDGIRALPNEQRAALVLREFQGLSYEEVADVLEISLAAVKGRIHRGRRTLTEGMGAWR